MKDGHFTKCFLWSETSELLSNPHSVQRRIHHKVAVRTLLEVNRVKKYYGRDSFLAKLFGREPTLVKAVDDVSFEVGTDEIFSLVGVMYLGKLCEIGHVESIFSPPYHHTPKRFSQRFPVPIPPNRKG